MEALLLPILLIAVFYFLLIRPQQKQRRQMAEMQQKLAVGSKVMTGGGLIAHVVAIEDDEVVLEVAPGVTNRYVRRAVVNVLSSPEGPESMLDDPIDHVGEDAESERAEDTSERASDDDAAKTEADEARDGSSTDDQRR